jgi:hypothetical protein
MLLGKFRKGKEVCMFEYYYYYGNGDTETEKGKCRDRQHALDMMKLEFEVIVIASDHKKNFEDQPQFFEEDNEVDIINDQLAVA